MTKEQSLNTETEKQHALPNPLVLAMPYFTQEINELQAQMQQLLCHQLSLSTRAGRTSDAHYHCPQKGCLDTDVLYKHPKCRNYVIYQV